jgi:hypothetical protein
VGELERGMSDPKNQHYLPRFYLKGFSDADVPGLLYVYKKGYTHCVKRGVKSVASQDYLHSFRDSTGKMRHEIETMFSQLEAHFSPVLRKVLTEQALTNDEEYILACFLMTTWQRIPEQVDHFTNIVTGVGQDILNVSHYHYTQNLDALDRAKAQSKHHTGKDDIDGLKAEDFDLNEVRVEANRHATLMLMIENVISLSEIVPQMGWTFLKSGAPDFFITSDSPFCLINPVSKGEFYKTGLDHQNVEISMPLSRNLAFLAGWKTNGRRWLPASEHLVAQINYRTACFASRELIAPKRIFPGSEKLLANFS